MNEVCVECGADWNFAHQACIECGCDDHESESTQDTIGRRTGMLDADS